MTQMSQITDQFEPGMKVVIVQQIAQRNKEPWVTRTSGTVEKFEQRKTGSWFAHSKDDKLWLDRLVLRKDDGEIVIVHLDQYTHVELAPNAADAEA